MALTMRREIFSVLKFGARRCVVAGGGHVYSDSWSANFGPQNDKQDSPFLPFGDAEAVTEREGRVR